MDDGAMELWVCTRCGRDGRLIAFKEKLIAGVGCFAASDEQLVDFGVDTSNTELLCFVPQAQ